MTELPWVHDGEIDADALLSAARATAMSAYAPYSRFRVGSAVLAGETIVTGCNVENASFGLSICAERVAIFKAVSGALGAIRAIAVACIDAPAGGDPEGLMPCGACRQVMAEFGGDELVVLVDGVGRLRLIDLLPRPFRLSVPESDVP